MRIATVHSNTLPTREHKTTPVRCWGVMYPAYADDAGVVRVYDPVAGHYTTCHRLSARVIARVRTETKPRES